jgi:hypothetical protein
MSQPLRVLCGNLCVLCGKWLRQDLTTENTEKMHTEITENFF